MRPPSFFLGSPMPRALASRPMPRALPPGPGRLQHRGRPAPRRLRPRALLAAVALASALLAAGAPARAAGPSAGAAMPGGASEAALAAAQADTLFHDAGQAYDAGDFALARDLYERAFRNKKTHDIAAMLAQTEIKLGKPCAAEAHLAWAVANFPPSLADERRARIERALTDVKKQLGALRVVVTPADAAVQVDFEPVAPSALPGPICAAAGERLVFVSHDGFAVERRLVPVQPGDVATVTVDLRRLAPAPAGAAPASGGPGAPAPPSAVSSSSSSSSSPSSSSAAARGPRPIHAEPPAPPPSILTPLAFSGLAVGAAGVLAGALLLPVAADKGQRAGALEGTLAAGGLDGACNAGSDHSAACGELRSLREDQATLLNVAFTSLIAGASLGALSGGILLARPPVGGGRPGGPRVTVGGARDGAFIAVEGAF